MRGRMPRHRSGCDGPPSATMALARRRSMGMDTPAGPSFSRIFRRGWALMALGLIVGLAGGLVYSDSQGKTYSSTAEILIKPLSRDLLQDASKSNTVSLDTEATIVQSDAVLREASAALP